MSILEIILIWSLCSVIAWMKQKRTHENENKKLVSEAIDKNSQLVMETCTVVLGPIWLAGAIIRQVLIEDWQ